MKKSLLGACVAGVILTALHAPGQPASAGGKPNIVITPTSAGSQVPRAADSAYRLAPNDLIEIKVYDEKDLDTRVRISDNGTVKFPLLGEIKVSGLTDRQAQAMIEEMLGRDYLVSPQVTLTVAEPTKRRFVVIGLVRAPNVYEIPFGEGIDLLQAIARAGGFAPNAKETAVIVSRTVDGQKRTFAVDARAQSRNPNSPPFEILPGDTIEVKESVF